MRMIQSHGVLLVSLLNLNRSSQSTKCSRGWERSNCDHWSSSTFCELPTTSGGKMMGSMSSERPHQSLLISYPISGLHIRSLSRCFIHCAANTPQIKYLCSGSPLGATQMLCGVYITPQFSFQGFLRQGLAFSKHCRRLNHHLSCQLLTLHPWFFCSYSLSTPIHVYTNYPGP